MANIIGSGGNDVLGPSAGNEQDTLYGLGGDDTLYGGGGTDLLYGGTGNDLLYGGAGADSLYGDEGNDTLYGDGQNDTLYGGDGDDWLIGGGGNDQIFGGAGLDIVDYGTATSGITYNFSTSTIGVDGTDTLLGIEGINLGSGNDSVTGNAEDNVMFGNAGNDTLYGGLGADSLYGGTGNDVLAGGGGNDLLDGGNGNDLIYGDADDDILYGGAGNDLLYGGTGNDRLYAGPGTDTLYGDAGNDVLVAGPNGNFLFGGTGDDTLVSGAGADSLNGGQGMDFVDYSASGAGVTVDLAAGTGAGGHAAGDSLGGIDGIYGSAFDDVLYGFDNQGTGGGDIYTNIFYGGAGNDLMYGRGGDDILYGGADRDTIYGGSGNDTVDGGDGNDLLYGDTGNDVVRGGAGNDTIFGGAGVDTLYGGSDRDTFVFQVGDAAIGEVVVGGEGGDDFDILDLSAYGAAFGWSRVVIQYTNDDPTTESGTVTLYAADGVTILGTINFSEIEQIIPCFTIGTLIATPDGLRPVESLRVGDLVLTRDHGPQPLLWVGRRKLARAELLAQPDLQPVLIARDALGPQAPARDMLVSPQHRILIEGARAELLFAEPEVLVPARHLEGSVNAKRVVPDTGVTYIHLLFHRHEIVQSDGLWTESFQPAVRMLSAMDKAVRAEIVALFPEIDTVGVAFEGARLSIKAHEARVLFAAE
ncbi:Hint domain-containing protein [Tabrizicola caldifontis]|uniref:Hint domain-containing protein n=1 Tax=Tabrizicola caldifontis TaxID=2528036 RepID=UPI00108005A1|nr:Hint domain-containing protein [Rhodobacter sp. YIM 73028]